MTTRAAAHAGDLVALVGLEREQRARSCLDDVAAPRLRYAVRRRPSTQARSRDLVFAEFLTRREADDDRPCPVDGLESLRPACPLGRVHLSHIPQLHGADSRSRMVQLALLPEARPKAAISRVDPRGGPFDLPNLETGVGGGDRVGRNYEAGEGLRPPFDLRFERARARNRGGMAWLTDGACRDRTGDLRLAKEARYGLWALRGVTRPHELALRRHGATLARNRRS